MRWCSGLANLILGNIKPCIPPVIHNAVGMIFLTACLWFLLYNFVRVSGDKIVYLDRLDASNGTMWEPYFNPQNINAAIGEVIHFIARLEDIKAKYQAVSTKEFRAENRISNHSCGPLLNQITPNRARIIKVRMPGEVCSLKSGYFSGFWVMDPQGTWNGSTFTVIVGDTKPHFFYSVSPPGWYYKNCTRLLEYKAAFTIPNGSDIVFALNPVRSIWTFFN